MSLIKFYSYATAAENLRLTADTKEEKDCIKGKIAFKPNFFLEVALSESYPLQHGEVSSTPQKHPTQHTDSTGKLSKQEVLAGSSVRAKWLKIGDSNRITPPNIRRGERLMVYRLGDTDKYFWDTIDVDNHLRKLETVIWVFSATQKEEDGIDLDNYYYIVLSTHDKKIRLQTSAANNEPYRYSIQIDTDGSTVDISDDNGNKIHLSSKEHVIALENTDKSSVIIDKTEIFLNANDKITMNTSVVEINASTKVDINTPVTTLSDKLVVKGKSWFHDFVTFLNGFAGH